MCLTIVSEFLNQDSSLCCTFSFNITSQPRSFASITILGQVSKPFGKKINPLIIARVINQKLIYI